MAENSTSGTADAGQCVSQGAEVVADSSPPRRTRGRPRRAAAEPKPQAEPRRSPRPRRAARKAEEAQPAAVVTSKPGVATRGRTRAAKDEDPVTPVDPEVAEDSESAPKARTLTRGRKLAAEDTGVSAIPPQEDELPQVVESLEPKDLSSQPRAPNRGGRRAPKAESVAPASSSPEKQMAEVADALAASSKARGPPRRRGGPNAKGTSQTHASGNAVAEVAEELESEASTSRPRATTRGRKRAPKSKEPAASTSRLPESESVDLAAGWSALPKLLLMKIFSIMENEDVVSAGQSCQDWRAVAKQPSVWCRRQLSYDLPPAADKKFQDWHGGARAFAVTIRFAPCLARVSCAKTMKAAARSAIATQSTCQVKSAELNGQLKWSEKYICQQQSLVELMLLNPTVQALQIALSRPRLSSLVVAFERDTTKEKYQQKYTPWPGSAAKYQVPALPSGSKGTLKKVICHAGVRYAAVQALVLANADSLEEVGAHCLPMAALQRCTKLRRLMVKLNPANSSDQDKIRKLVKGGMEYVAFIGTRSHASKPCATLRASLRKQVRGCTVVCSACENVCALEKPSFASREVSDLKDDGDDDGGELDLSLVANLLRGAGKCRCICCASEEWGDGELDD